ncbi:hypothetical protein [Micromonospora sp. LOL_021]|uniref:hypothetical protein n=1 Tax=Micromonospora sp. LOL_021 TaxID=3345417 RepID=UPI003A8B340A
MGNVDCCAKGGIKGSAETGANGGQVGDVGFGQRRSGLGVAGDLSGGAEAEHRNSSPVR